MPAFRVVDPFTVWIDDQGQPVAGGSLAFYQAGTTTPKDVYGEKALSTNNGPVIDLDSAGRATVDIWGDGSYRVRLYDADDVLIVDRDDVEIPGGNALTLPDPVDGEYLVGNGTQFVTAPIRQVPDPTGQTGKKLGNDGENAIWESAAALPDLPTEGIEIVTGGVRIGNLLILRGSDTASGSGVSATKAVTFSQAFNALPTVLVSITGATTNAGYYIDEQGQDKSTTGFTAAFNGDHGEAGTGNISSVPFDWVAIGTTAT